MGTMYPSLVHVFSRIRKSILARVYRTKKPRTNALNFPEGIHFENGPSREIFVIAFSGGGARLMINPYDFMSVTRLMDYPRIYLQDNNDLWYQTGVSREVPSFDRLCEHLADKVKEFGAKKLLILGTSSGGFAALLAGHILGADYVHVFGPQTNIALSSLRNSSKRPFWSNRVRRMCELYIRQWRNRRHFDLRRAMSSYNGKTRYYVHYCAQHFHDRVLVEHIADIGGVQILAYPCAKHRVIETMLGNGYIEQLFTSKYLDNPHALFEMHYDVDTKAVQVGEAETCSRDTLAGIVCNAAMGRPSVEQVCKSRDLVGELGLDSMAFLQIVVELENTFGIRISREEVQIDDLRTVESIARFVDKAIAEK